MSIQRFERGKEDRVSSQTRRNLRHWLKNAPKWCLDMVQARKTRPSPPTTYQLFHLPNHCQQQTQPTFEMTPGFKPFTVLVSKYLGCKLKLHITTTTSAKKKQQFEFE